MIAPCEISAKYIIPALRLMIAKKLIEEYHITQSEVARLLGVTQPSISHYLNSRRGARTAKALAKSKEVREYVDKYVKRVISSGAPPDDLPFCIVCKAALKQILGKRAARVKRYRAGIF